MQSKSPTPTPCEISQQQSRFSILEHNLQEQLKKYSLESIEELLDILIDPQLSVLFKSKFDQCLQAKEKDSQMTDNQKHLKKLSSEHTYQEIHTYYELFPNLLQECRSVLQQKYLTDDILRSHHHRKSIWLLCSGALSQLKQHPNFHHSLTQYRSSTYPEFYKHTIEKDVVRTIQDKSEAQSTLNSILRNFAIKNPFIGYCQGMNFIVNFLLIMQFTEEQAFWLTTQLIEQLLPKTYYSNMLGVAIDITVIEHYIKLHHPLLSQKLSQMNLSLSLFTLQWLVCLFTSTLPFYMLVIVWDMLIIYGSQILVQVAIVILSELEDTILQTDDISQLLGLIQQKKKGIFIEEDKFIQKILQIHIDPSLLTLARQLIELKLMKEKSQASAENLKPQRKHIEVQCNVEWPICFKALKQHKSDLGEIQVWTFKEQGPPNLIHDYLVIKNKKSYKPQPSQKTEEHKLMIGRIPHDCNVNQYNKKHTTKKQAIQLQEYADNNEHHLGLVGLQKNQHIIFYERATSMNLSFLQFAKPKSPQKKVSNYNYRPSSNQNSTKKQIKIKPVQSQQHELHSSIESQAQQHSRNPFKKIKSKWKQRKLKHLEKS